MAKVTLVATSPPGMVAAVKRPPADITARWGGDSILMSRGWVGVPVSFLESLDEFRPHRVGIAEAMFIICLMAHKWDERAPFPGYKKIARWLGKSESYVRKLARTLETKGFLKRIDRIGDTNAFDLTPLFTKLAAKLRGNELAAARSDKKTGKKKGRSTSTRRRPAVA
jgi:hypothetical protein